MIGNGQVRFGRRVLEKGLTKGTSPAPHLTPPAWTDQLTPGGRIVVPLRVRGLTRSVALERVDGVLRSRSLVYCGFIPMRGAGHCPEPTLQLSDDIDVRLRLDDGRPADAGVLRGVLDHPACHIWLGIHAAQPELGHLEFWLAAMDGFCRLLARHDAIDGQLVEPMYRWGSMAVFDHDTFAYLTMRPAPHDHEQNTFELGVCAYGPQDNSSPATSPSKSAAGTVPADH